jgi:hypothetical protein
MKFPPCVSPKTGRWLALAAALLLAGGAVLFNSMSAPEAPPPLAIPPSRPERFVAPPPPPAEHLLVLRGEALAAQAGTAPGPAPAVPELHENFDRAQPGALPGGWSRWSSDSAATVGASPNRAASAPNGLAFSGNTQAVVRAFPTATVPADVQVSALVYLDTLMPAQLLVRGSGLNTAAPSYYAAAVTRGLEVQLLRVVRGTAAPLGTVKSATYLSGKWVRLTLSASGNSLRVQVYRPDTAQYLSAAGQWQSATAWALQVNDGQIPTGTQVGVGKGPGVGGTFYVDDFTAGRPDPATPREPPPPPAPQPAVLPLPRPAIPRHLEHIRIAMLAYRGAPFGAFEEQLLRNSVDLVIPHTGLLERIRAVAPNTPQLIYTNTSNLYLELLTDWLAYADRRGLPREAAFFHATRPVAFRGDSASSRPVNMFWGVYRGGGKLTDVTSTAASGSGRVSFGAAGESLYVGYPERFREINLRIASGPGAGWSAALEYVTGTDAAGAPARWAPLPTLADSTARLTQTGHVFFDPPADWRPASGNGSAPLFYVRFRTTGAGTPPAASAILGRDYVQANGAKAGTVPVFDAQADANRDGYLNDQEYARRAPGKDARFLYESRLMTESYGPMRPATNPSSPAFRAWAVDFHQRMLARSPIAAGVFMDNASGKPPVKQEDALEPIDNYGRDAGAMLAAIWRAIAPRWVLANTGGAGSRADAVVQACPAYFEEYGIRPLSHNWSFFEDLATTVARRATLANPAPLAVLDSHPQRGNMTDPRTQLGALAYYYLLADPDTTFLVFFGGYEPATSWTRHWISAASYNIGRPRGRWSQRATGPDPSNPALSYRLYQREYDRALVLFKPLSYARGTTATASNGDETATRHDLGAAYRPLRADGSTGEPVTSITLRNGEGALLIKP